MTSRRDGAGGASQSGPRQNEYFVPRDGIDREVITADVCRYLGNDALVRPGIYTDPKTGQTMQGYLVTAYRALTSAMIQDLKNDSARWEAERRSHSGARYGDSSSRFSNGSAAPVQYPGNDAPGYSGAGSGPAPTNYQYDNRQVPYQGSGYPQGSSFQSPAQDSRYGSQPPQGGAYGSSYGNTGYPVYSPEGGAPYMDLGVNSRSRQDPRMASNSYGGGPSTNSPYYAQSQYAAGQPMDPMYGRGNFQDPQAGRANTFQEPQGSRANTIPVSGPEYSAAPPQSAYEFAPPPYDGTASTPLPRGATSSPTTAPAHTGTSGSSHSHTHRHRDRDARDSTYSKADRHRRPQ